MDFETKPDASQLDRNNIPQSIAIIMDGNGRWAQEKGLPRSSGHLQGVDNVTRITSECARLGVKYLTMYTFSTENWNRPEAEVKMLMGLVVDKLEDEIFMKNDIRFRYIGDLERLPAPARQSPWPRRTPRPARPSARLTRPRRTSSTRSSGGESGRRRAAWPSPCAPSAP